jgi:hypothetical protein
LKTAINLRVNGVSPTHWLLIFSSNIVVNG